MSKPFMRCSVFLGLLLDGLAEFWRYLQTGEFIVSVLAGQWLVFSDVCNPGEPGSATSKPGDRTVFYWVSPSMHQEMTKPCANSGIAADLINS